MTIRSLAHPNRRPGTSNPNAAALGLLPRWVKTGQTPRREVARWNKSRLYRYDSERRFRTPLLFVPNLGISRPYIFDLLPDRSFFEHLTRAGFDLYLIDWGIFGEEDRDFDFGDAVRLLARTWDAIRDDAGAEQVGVIAYCMGLPLTAALLATRPHIGVRTLVSLAAPIDFSQAGLFSAWLDSRWFDPGQVAELYPLIPASFFQLSGLLLRPTMGMTLALDLWWHGWDREYVEEVLATTTWVRDFIPCPQRSSGSGPGIVIS